jgi:hypothetical protein
LLSCQLAPEASFNATPGREHILVSFSPATACLNDKAKYAFADGHFVRLSADAASRTATRMDLGADLKTLVRRDVDLDDDAAATLGGGQTVGAVCDKPDAPAAASPDRVARPLDSLLSSPAKLVMTWSCAPKVTAAASGG